MSESKIPKNERIWTIYKRKSDNKDIYILTSKIANRDYYYLYEVTEEYCVNKLGRAETPTELEKKYKVIEQMLST